MPRLIFADQCTLRVGEENVKTSEKLA